MCQFVVDAIEVPKGPPDMSPAVSVTVRMLLQRAKWLSGTISDIISGNSIFA
jgi:hypothetical protein